MMEKSSNTKTLEKLMKWKDKLIENSRLKLVKRLKNWVKGATKQKLVRSWHHLSSIYSVSPILPLPLLLLRTHLRTPLAFVPPFSGFVNMDMIPFL
jgi:hypothetical protein